MQKEQKFHHSLPLQLRFNDIDVLGHLNNSVYFTFFDLGKADYFELTTNGRVDWKNIGVVVANMNVDFYVPTFLKEKVAVQTAVTEIGNRSFRMIQHIVNIETGEIKCECHTTMVGFDPVTNRSADISMEWKEFVCSYEGKDLFRKKA